MLTSAAGGGVAQPAASSSLGHGPTTSGTPLDCIIIIPRLRLPPRVDTRTPRSPKLWRSQRACCCHLSLPAARLLAHSLGGSWSPLGQRAALTPSTSSSRTSVLGGSRLSPRARSCRRRSCKIWYVRARAHTLRSQILWDMCRCTVLGSAGHNTRSSSRSSSCSRSRVCMERRAAVVVVVVTGVHWTSRRLSRSPCILCSCACCMLTPPRLCSACPCLGQAD